MYDHLVGEVVEAHGTRAVLRCAGIGYELKVPLRTSATLAEQREARLFTILHVVDGAPTLLGFATRGERDLARRILTVSGVGPAIALALLSTYEPGAIAGMILGGEAKALQRVKGVGAKTAERLCLELRDHVGKLGFAAEAAPTATRSPAQDDAIAALVTLGFAEREARAKVEKAAERDAAAGTEDLIRAVLRG